MHAPLALLLAATLDVQTHTLTNGMKILVHEDHDIPNVAMYLFYRIGSRNERPGTTGLSHFFEHMMFNGAKKYGPKQFDVQMEKNGGRNNAYTTRDITAYTDWFPRNMLDLMFDLEADRIRDLSFDPKMIESERGVVYSERRSSVENNNAGLLYEQLIAAAYTAHPYGWPVVGWSSDIESWTLDDLQAHFRMGYAPNNCVVVVTGDVTATEIQALSKKYFEPIPRQQPPPPVRTREPEQTGERRVVIRKPAQLPLLMVSYHVPASSHADYETLRVLGNLLSEGRSSRLYRRLVDRDQLAIQTASSLEHSLDPGEIVLNIQPRSGVDLARLEKALFEEVDGLVSSPVSADELQKAKNQLLTALYRDWKTIAGKADLLGRYEVFFGDYRRLFNAEKDLEQVTAAGVQRAAKQYLHDRNRTIATLIPEAAP
jgi:zinc protease